MLEVTVIHIGHVNCFPGEIIEGALVAVSLDPIQQQLRSGEAGTPSNDLEPCVAVLVNAVAKGMAELVAPHDLIPLEFALLRVFLGEEERTTTQWRRYSPSKCPA